MLKFISSVKKYCLNILANLIVKDEQNDGIRGRWNVIDPIADFKE